MCGILGFSGTDDFDLFKIKILGLFNEGRGRDATGIFSNTNGLIKSTEEATKFFSMDVKTDKLLVGHTRSKTTGSNIRANAHPFRYGNIVMAHNGVISNWKDLIKFPNRLDRSVFLFPKL